jgi:REP element-mobilizing transposase RayT
VIHRTLEAARRRPDFAAVHFSIQGNHLHLIGEAASSAALSNAVRSLSIRLARGLNRMMGRSGPVLADRYDAHVLARRRRSGTRCGTCSATSRATRRGGATRCATGGWIRSRRRWSRCRGGRRRRCSRWA